MIKKQVALITGASSGIGEAIAVELASQGYALALLARRAEKLEKLRINIVQEYGVDVLTLNADVRSFSAIEKAIQHVEQHFGKIDVLVNNAGLALGLNTIDAGDVSDWDTMIDTNIKGVLYSTRSALHLLQKSANPLIINIGSIAGREVYPNGNVYCATKAAVDSLTKAMRIDLLSKGIKVTQVSPGATETEFSEVRFKGDTSRAKDIYKGFVPLTGKDIAQIIGFIVALPEHVNINDVLVMPKQQATAAIINKNA